MFRTVACIAALTAMTAAAHAAEEKIALDSGGTSIAGVLNIPDGSEKPPVVLILHGFTGQKEEFVIGGTETGLFTDIARRLAEAGIASLRIDFAGSGESGGAWEDTTFSGQIADAVAVFDQLQVLPNVDGSRIGILGYSQGGLVGAHLAAARPETDAVVLWAPVTNPIETYGTIMGREKIAAALAAPADKVITSDLSWGGSTNLKARFFHEMPAISAAGAISGYSGPLRLIVGSQETIVAPQPAAAEQLLRYHDGVEDIVVMETDHDFGAGASIAPVDEYLGPSTVSWFSDNL